MVTGAGGSIGSELCGQIAALGPARLILYERFEGALYTISSHLADSGFGQIVYPLVGDVTDVHRLDEAMTKHRPEIVFHAAAHKHVPLMEQNPCEAVKNNVVGTQRTVEAAERHGVERFIFISSDKAVNPSSVMGATKRVAELALQARARQSGTALCMVRFGNVLGSSGSVVPRFMEQIKAGGPVTVTDPEIARYFMLLPEAAQLVLHAAAIAEPGAMYTLDMGEPIKILDLAQSLIRLSGFAPDEIPVTVVGLRPGEKLSEELLGSGESVRPSGVEKILCITDRRRPGVEWRDEPLRELERVATTGDAAATIQQLGVIVPGFGCGTQATSLGVGQAAPLAEPSPEPAAHQQSAAAASGPLCPECGSPELHWSHARTRAEQLRKQLTDKRLCRCHGCGWRGWAAVTELTQGSPHHVAGGRGHGLDAPDFGGIYAALRAVSSVSRPVGLDLD